MERFQVITSSEAASLWRLDASTIRRAIGESRLQAQKSGGTWLIYINDMINLYGRPQPDSCDGNNKKGVSVEKHGVRFEDIGFVPGNQNRRVLKGDDGSFVIVSCHFMEQFEKPAQSY